MNAGKLVAQIAVVAIVVYFCYSAVATAIPTELNDPAKIFGPEGDFEIHNINPVVKEVFSVTGFKNVLTVK